MPSRPKIHAILLGDIVGSEAAPSPRAMHRAFNRAVADAGKRHAAAIRSPLTITLGDEFQGLLTGLAPAWDAAQDLRFALLGQGISCRFVIGVVALETPLNRKRAWNMMGAGLSAARNKLNEKQAHNAYRFTLPGELMIERLADAVGEALTQAELGWTETQLRYFAARRAASRTNAQIARALGVSARAYYKVLRAARADFHGRQTTALRQALTELDARYGLAR